MPDVITTGAGVLVNNEQAEVSQSGVVSTKIYRKAAKPPTRNDATQGTPGDWLDITQQTLFNYQKAGGKVRIANVSGRGLVFLLPEARLCQCGKFHTGISGNCVKVGA